MTMPRPARFALLPALAVLLAGCNLGPHYKQPALEIPPAFRATPVSATQAWPSPDWWRGFGSPELDDLIAEARGYNQNLAAAIARVLQADAQVRISGAPLLPSVSASGSGSWQHFGSQGRSSRSSSGLSFGSGGVDEHTYSLTGNISYELDFWGKNRATLQSAEASAIASRFDQETVALTVVSSVATTYFTALALKDELAIAKHNLADAEQVLAVIRGRLAVGTASALDVAQEEAQVATQRAQIPNLQSQLEQEIIALGILVGRPPAAIKISTDTLTRMKAPEVAPGLPSELLARRPDVANAEAQLIAENGSVRAARAAFFPSLTLSASGGWQSGALGTLFSPGAAIGSVTGSIVQTIFDNGNLQGQLDLTKGRYQELVADYRQAVLQAFTDVDTAMAAYRYATEQEKLQQQAVATAQRSADIARAQLAAGTVDVTTVLTAQVTLYTAQTTLAQVRLARFQALVNLYKALGGGWRQPAIHIPGAA